MYPAVQPVRSQEQTQQACSTKRRAEELRPLRRALPWKRGACSRAAEGTDCGTFTRWATTQQGSSNVFCKGPEHTVSLAVVKKKSQNVMEGWIRRAGQPLRHSLENGQPTVVISNNVGQHHGCNIGPREPDPEHTVPGSLCVRQVRARPSCCPRRGSQDESCTPEGGPGRGRSRLLRFCFLSGATVHSVLGV